MPKRGTKCAANVFYLARMEAAKYNDRLASREGAAEVTGIERNRIAYTELGTICPYPEEVLVYADAYNAPELMNHFCSHAVSWCQKKDMAIIVPNTVEDLTGLINDTQYEFRAMMELTLYFTMEAIGYTANLDISSVVHTDPETGETYTGGDIQAEDVTGLEPIIKETPSGGGNAEMVAEETGYFKNVRINDKLIKEETENE